MADASDAAHRLAEAWRQSQHREDSARAAPNRIEASPETVLDSFRRAVGPAGTLVFPLLNFGFTRGEPFDIGHTRSKMGALTEAVRTQPDAVRTGHPIYSFAALGRQANEFRGVVNRSGYGGDPPFGIIHRLGGKIAVLDLPDQSSMAFYHYVEELEGVPYRLHKQFTGPYVDAGGIASEMTFSLFVRDLERGVLTDFDRMGEELWHQGSTAAIARGRERVARDRGAGVRRRRAGGHPAGRAADYLSSIESA